jgi:hypothetical protein
MSGWIFDLASRLAEGSISESMQRMTKAGSVVCRGDIFVGTGEAVRFCSPGS